MYMYILVTCCVFLPSLITGYVDSLKQMIEEHIDWLAAFKGKVTECMAALLGVNFLPSTCNPVLYNLNLTDTGQQESELSCYIELINFYRQEQVDGNILRK